jgi:hypothetical protein
MGLKAYYEIIIVEFTDEDKFMGMFTFHRELIQNKDRQSLANSFGLLFWN